MKKTFFILLLSLVLALVPSLSFAKTEGNYLGLNLNFLSPNYKFGDSRNVSQRGNSSNLLGSDAIESVIGLGLNYKYAFNFDDFFIAPGIFYDDYGGKQKSEDVSSDSFIFGANKPLIAINEAYGAKLDFGYDITERISLYTSQGGVMVDYQSYAYTNPTIVTSSKTNYNYQGSSYKKLGFFYGGGISIRAWEGVIFSFEYNRQRVDFNVQESALYYKDTLKANLDVFRIGVGYKF